MKKYMVSFFLVYEIEANDESDAEERAEELFFDDIGDRYGGMNSFNKKIEEIKP